VCAAIFDVSGEKHMTYFGFVPKYGYAGNMIFEET
jgi:hypothetical protein